MDPKALAGAQRDDQAEATFEEAIQSAIDSRLKETHTCLPGIIRKFDPATQTATVQPAIKRIFVEQGPVDLPLCVDVPVQFPAGGHFVLTFPVEPGDECLLVFSERAIDFWWDRGDVQLPAEYRMHDLSDAFAIVGVSHRGKAKLLVGGVRANAAELRTRDGTVVLRIDDNFVHVGGATGSQPAIMGTAYRTAEDTYFAALETYLGVLGGLPGMAGAAATFAAAATAFHGAAATFLATKAKVL